MKTERARVRRTRTLLCTKNRNRVRFRGFAVIVCLLFAVSLAADAHAATEAIASKTADVGGLKIHYLISGQGPAVILLHGYTQTSRMWRPIIPARAQRFTVVAPDLPDQDYIHDKYMNELINGVFLPETRAGLLAVVDRVRETSGIDGVILGGTELPLILRESHYEGIPFLNTTKIHVEAAVDRMLS